MLADLPTPQQEADRNVQYVFMPAAKNSANNAAGPEANLAPDVVRHIARLSRLELDEATSARFGRQLGAVLQHARALSELDLSGVAPLVYPGESADVWAADEPGPLLPADVALKMAPQSHPPYFKTPKALGDSSQS